MRDKFDNLTSEESSTERIAQMKIVGRGVVSRVNMRQVVRAVDNGGDNGYCRGEQGKW